MIGELVHIKLHTVGRNWSGVMRLGVTCHDPAHLSEISLPRYACPDLTNQPGYWAKAILEPHCVQGICC